jgi:DNA-binding NtrC family response regulator
MMAKVKKKYEFSQTYSIEWEEGDDIVGNLAKAGMKFLPAAIDSAAIQENDFTLEGAEAAAIKKALAVSDGIAAAARLLGITRATLYAKVKKYEIESTTCKCNNLLIQPPDNSA